jgi:hypothetical protein
VLANNRQARAIWRFRSPDCHPAERLLLAPTPLQAQHVMTGGVWQYGHHVTYVLAVTVTLLVLRRAVKRYGGEVAERVALVVLRGVICAKRGYQS